MTRQRSLIVGLLVLVALAVALVISGGKGELASVSDRVAADVPDSSAPAEQADLQAVPGKALALPADPVAERQAVDGGTRDLPVQVLELEGNQGLAGVPLLLEQKDLPEAIEGLSDADGRYLFTDLPPGDYTLTPGPLGDLDYRADPVPVVVGDAVPEEVVLRVERRWFLAGTVVEVGSRRPVADAALSARRGTRGGRYLGTSSPDGHFRSRKSFSAGALTLFLSEQETSGLVRTGDEGPELLEVLVGEGDVTHLIVEVDWVGVLRGVVLDQQGSPVSQADVRVLSGDSFYLRSPGSRFWATYKGLSDRGRTARSDDLGRFEFRRLPNDRSLVLIANAPGFAFGRSPDLSPPFPQGEERVELRLPRGGSILGKILDNRGEPVREAFIVALSPDTDYQPDPARSDEQGDFRLVSLMPGSTEVSAKIQGDRGNRQLIASGEVVVVAGEEVKLTLHAGADGVHLSGVAVDQHGKVITSDRMRLSLRTNPLDPLPGERSWGTDGPIQEDGTFEVTVPREGKYRLTLLGSLVGDRWESQDVQAPAHDLRLTFAVVPTGILTVRMLDALSGELIPRGSISISWDRGSIGGGVIGGEHHAHVREGLYTLTVDAKGYAPASQELDLRADLQPEILVEMRLDHGRQLSGIVQDGAGEPVKGSTVVLIVGGRLQLENLVYSGADGHFEIPSVPITGGSVCVIDDAFRTLAVVEIGTGDAVLTIDGD